MKACCCVLPYMNPNACKNCLNNKDDVSEFYLGFFPYPNETYQPKEWQKDTTHKEVIEKFDKDGKLIERITREI